MTAGAPKEVMQRLPKNRATKTTKTAAPRTQFLERDDETTTTVIVYRAPHVRVSNRDAVYTVLARDARPHGSHASPGLRASRCVSSGAALDELGCPRRSPGKNLPSQGRPARFLPCVDGHHRAQREGRSPHEPYTPPRRTHHARRHAFPSATLPPLTHIVLVVGKQKKNSTAGFDPSRARVARAFSAAACASPSTSLSGFRSGGTSRTTDSLSRCARTRGTCSSGRATCSIKSRT